MNELIDARNKEVYSIALLNRAVRQILDGHFPPVWVEGEISNLRKPGSAGHLYFSLKDATAQVRCAMFRSRSALLNFEPKDGMHILAHAKVSLYEERGDYQIIIDFMEETGDGKLRQAFDALKKRLAQEGLFDSSHKRPLPELPRQIGVITSATGAAIRDILSVLKRRFPAIPVIIYPTAVQGNEAALQIVTALETANVRCECDVLILARGGGSLEDLWPFNEEIVARAIYHSHIPVVCGIGHEIDFTIADFVADQRAPTPSAAAELVSPDQYQWQEHLTSIHSRLIYLINAKLKQAGVYLENLTKRLQHPGERLLQHAQRIDDLEARLCLAQMHFLRHKQAKIQHFLARLQQHTPQHLLSDYQTLNSNLEHRLFAAMRFYLSAQQQQLIHLMHELDAVSPLNTLQRGYAIVRKQASVITDAREIAIGDKISARLLHGELVCCVEKINVDPSQIIPTLK